MQWNFICLLLLAGNFQQSEPFGALEALCGPWLLLSDEANKKMISAKLPHKRYQGLESWAVYRMHGLFTHVSPMIVIIADKKGATVLKSRKGPTWGFSEADFSFFPFFPFCEFCE